MAKKPTPPKSQWPDVARHALGLAASLGQDVFVVALVLIVCGAVLSVQTSWIAPIFGWVTLVTWFGYRILQSHLNRGALRHRYNDVEQELKQISDKTIEGSATDLDLKELDEDIQGVVISDGKDRSQK